MNRKEIRLARCREEINVQAPNLISLLRSIVMFERLNGRVTGAIEVETVIGVSLEEFKQWKSQRSF